MSVRLLVATLTDVGRVRPANEDAFLVDDATGLVAVADGMGGHQAGEVASAIAIDTLRDGIARGDRVDTAITAANAAVLARASEDLALRGMGTTMTAGVLDGDMLVIGHVGDSRAYLLRDGALRQVTTDHSVIAELIAAGQLTEADALVDPRRAMITRALGIDVAVAVDVLPVELAPGDRLLLCSDGLTTMLRDDAIAGILVAEADRHAAAAALVAAANAAGGADNITVVIADVAADEEPEPPAPPVMPTASAPAAPPDPGDPPPPAVATAPLAPEPDAAPADPSAPVPTGAPPSAETPPSADATDDDAAPPRPRWWRRRPRA